jgi:Tfp pilus assembly protein FimT
LVIVLMIGSVILGIGSRQYSRLANQRAVTNARNAVISSSFRARSEAVRSGQLVYMRILPDSGSHGLVKVNTATGTVLHTLDAGDYGAQMLSNELKLCYTARGYALPGCSTPSDQMVGFVRGADTAAAVVTPLGQVRRWQ